MRPFQYISSDIELHEGIICTFLNVFLNKSNKI
jgi:hypothetical protein